MKPVVQSHLAYPVLVHPDPWSSGRKSLVNDLQHMPCIHTVCSIIRFPRLSGYFCGKRMCAVMQGLTVIVSSRVVFYYFTSGVPTGYRSQLEESSICLPPEEKLERMPYMNATAYCSESHEAPYSPAGPTSKNPRLRRILPIKYKRAWTHGPWGFWPRSHESNHPRGEYDDTGSNYMGYRQFDIPVITWTS